MQKFTLQKTMLLLALTLLLATVAVQAQTKIGATGAPNTSAVLELVSPAVPNARGLLAPLVPLTGVNDGLSFNGDMPATGLIVYNDGTAGLAPAGYYYNSGTPAAPVWTRFASTATGPANGAFWSLLGNSGTSAATNFIGTTDAVDFVTKTNNVERMRVLSTGNVGINIAMPNSTLHIDGSQAGASVEITTTGTSLTLDATHHFVDVFAASGTTAVTLPSVTGLQGREYLIRNAGAGIVTVSNTGGINLGSTMPTVVTLNQGQTLTVIAGSTQWQGILNTTSVTTTGVASVLQAMVLPAATQTITAATSGQFVEPAMDGASAFFSNSIQGATFNDATDEITLPAGTYTMTWIYEGEVAMTAGGTLVNFFYDTPNTAGFSRVHYTTHSIPANTNFGTTANFTLLLTAPSTFKWEIGQGSFSDVTTYIISDRARLTIVKIH